MGKLRYREGMLDITSAEDIQEVMALERGPGFERLVGRWEQEEHLAEIAKASSRYFVLRDRRGIAGFAIVQGLGDRDGKAHLKRIAVRDPGEGTGEKLLRLLLNWLFTKSATNRIDLDVFVGNARAKRAYEKAGFSTDGILRDFHREPDGSFRDMWLMTILRREWEARKRDA